MYNSTEAVVEGEIKFEIRTGIRIAKDYLTQTHWPVALVDAAGVWQE